MGGEEVERTQAVRRKVEAEDTEIREDPVEDIFIFCAQKSERKVLELGEPRKRRLQLLRWEVVR